jgi:hypothetical protein
MMNERILELARQASGQTFGHIRNAYFEKKFAELLVQECADYIDTFNKENMVDEGIGGTELKKHFGVEE